MTLNPGLMRADRNDWGTPAHVFGALHREFRFTLDGAANMDGSNALLRRWCGDVDHADWRRERVYCNPPYGRAQRAFVDRARTAALAVLLLPARPDTRTWHEAIFPFAREVRFVQGRLRFRGAAHPAPFPSCVVVWRGDRDRQGPLRVGTMDFRERIRGRRVCGDADCWPGTFGPFRSGMGSGRSRTFASGWRMSYGMARDRGGRGRASRGGGVNPVRLTLR